ncbi:hypothetical protein SKAU_G00031100 [Synaphobranchus kaupii]|uniref:Uncharacterized protein n=1 Tax=Synaphobranchus kaupii TaxID=118154 RepID=A0A9Q1JFW0_SYNKA|nr:hypothetical protein SKAU_G00031100 [Synaphobranchus kaupii]
MRVFHSGVKAILSRSETAFQLPAVYVKSGSAAVSERESEGLRCLGCRRLSSSELAVTLGQIHFLPVPTASPLASPYPSTRLRTSPMATAPSSHR